MLFELCFQNNSLPLLLLLLLLPPLSLPWRCQQVFTLPLPCDETFVKQLHEWQSTYEAEDLQQKREEYYGRGGGTTFGDVSELVWSAGGQAGTTMCWQALQCVGRLWFVLSGGTWWHRSGGACCPG
jgi:hypothetical protein